MDSRYPIIITLTGFQVANEAHCLLHAAKHKGFSISILNLTLGKL